MLLVHAAKTVFLTGETHSDLSVMLLCHFGLLRLPVTPDCFCYLGSVLLLTDHGDQILENCFKNIQLNSGVLNHQNVVYVRELDWTHPWPPKVSSDLATQER